jgi:hypothetical protein
MNSGSSNYLRHGGAAKHLIARHGHELDHAEVGHDHEAHEDLRTEHLLEGHIHDRRHPVE